jgi:hypothetical protein
MKNPATASGAKDEPDTKIIASSQHQILTSRHREMLEQESGIQPKVIETRGYRTVTTKAELARLGFSTAQQNVPALLIPVYGVTGEVENYQTRSDMPRIDQKRGKPIKYETPTNSHMTLDVHPFAQTKLRDPSTPLFVTEGIKKGDSLVSRDLCAIALIGVWNWRGTNEHGGKTALADWEVIALNGRKVYICFDSDVMVKKQVHQALVRLKAFLESRKAEVLLIYLPHSEGGKKQGVDDFLASGNNVSDLLSYATSKLKRFEVEENDSTLPEIQVNARHLRDITKDTVNALEKKNKPPNLFLRGTALARISSEIKIEILSRDSLKGVLDRVADFVTVRPDGGVTPSRPPSDLAPDIMTLPSLPFPKIEGISTVPLFMSDGSVLYKSGYDSESGLYLHLEGLESLNTNMPVDQALYLLLDDVFADFPFADEGGKAHILCMLLEPFLQRIIANVTPLYLIDAPIRGSGKGLSAEVVVSIVTGKTAPVMTMPSDGTELEKRITSSLLEGSIYLLFDNVITLKSPELAAAITTSIWRGRRLGQSQMLEVPNTSTWVVTGNNIQVSDEIARRIIPIRLDPGIERPEDRVGFKHPDLKSYVLNNRNTLVNACLSLIQAWVNEGMPKDSNALEVSSV